MANLNNTKPAFLKLLIFLFFTSLSYTACAQKQIFVRVFNLSGKKIYKGNVFAVTDSSLQLTGRKGTINISESNIGFIKTKRSAGSNIFLGSVIGGFAGGIVGATTADPDNYLLGYTAGESAAFAALFGAYFGAGIGALTTLFKHSKRYSIKGDNTKWKVFQSMINETMQ